MPFDIQQFFDRSPDLFCILGSDYRFQLVNASWSRCLGYAAEEMVGRCPSDFIHPDDRERTAKEYERLSEGGEMQLFDNRYIARDGSIRWLRRNAVFAQDLGVFLVVARDITGIVETQRLAEFYHTAIDQANIVAMVDLDGRISYVNELFCAISRYSRMELLGKSYTSLVSPSMPEGLFSDLRAAIAAGKPWKGEICNEAKDGKGAYWVDTVLVPLMDSSAKPSCYFSLQTDITEAKNLARHMAHSEKMSALGQMASEVVHEINNPLAIIKAKVEQMKAKAGRAEVDREALIRDFDKLSANCDRIFRIVKGMRSFSREGSADPMQLNSLADILADVAEVSRLKLKGAVIPLEVASVRKDLTIECRPSEILQILVNLIGNAADAIQGNAEKWIRVECREGNDSVLIAVTDSGAGIPIAARKRIFEPFFTTKEHGHGTGLGLSISKRIAEQHQGLLMINEFCKNTRFELILPKQQS